MTIFANNGGGGGGYMSGKAKPQVFPVDYEAQVSQRLVDAAHSDDMKAAFECITDPFVDVNYIGTVNLKGRSSEIILHDESAVEVGVKFQQFKTEVTPLFLAANAGNLTLLNKLLSVGANVNQKLFRGYAMTAAVREGHIEVLKTLLNSGVCQPACEEALLEASYLGRARPAELLMEANLIRPHIAVHALVTASCRGFVDVVETLIKCGVDPNATARVLLRSSKPSLHANVDCNSLVAAIVSRQTAIVQLLLQKGGAKTDTKVRLGAWSWDTATGEEFRVGAGLADPYNVTWCAVEYFEASGAILRLLLQHISHTAPHLGRTIIHHAVLCGNARAVEALLNCGADVEVPIKTTEKTEFRSIHLAARLGFVDVLQPLIDAGCNLDSKTEAGETALMICVRYKRVECLKLLASAGADFGLLTLAGLCAKSIAGSMQWTAEFQNAVLDVVRADKVPHSSNTEIFAPLVYVTQANDTVALKKLLQQSGVDIDEQDEKGFSAVMVAAAGGHVEAFQLLVYAGADVKLRSKYGETAISLSEGNPNNSDAFEKVMLEYALGKGNHCSGGFYALHRAARRGDLDNVCMLTSGGYDVNIPDSDGYTPLMLAAKEGHGRICELLISCGAKIDVENARHETALLLARMNGPGNEAEGAILDELARVLVLEGACVKKYRREGKRSSHGKLLKMVGNVGALSWGKSSKRNVICKGAEVGPSAAFRWNRRKKNDADKAGIFRVVTTKNKEFHFLCDGGTETAELWVRGIKLVTREAIFGNKVGDAR